MAQSRPALGLMMPQCMPNRRRDWNVRKEPLSTLETKKLAMDGWIEMGLRPPQHHGGLMKKQE